MVIIELPAPNGRVFFVGYRFVYTTQINEIYSLRIWNLILHSILIRYSCDYKNTMPVYGI